MDQRDIEVVSQGATCVFYQIFNPAGSLHKPANKISKSLIPENRSIIRMTASFHPYPSPLVLDEHGKQLHSANEIGSEYDHARETVYFNIIGVFYSLIMHIKPRMVPVRKHAPDTNAPRAKRLRAEIL